MNNMRSWWGEGGNGGHHEGGRDRKTQQEGREICPNWPYDANILRGGSRKNSWETNEETLAAKKALGKSQELDCRSRACCAKNQEGGPTNKSSGGGKNP